MKLACWRWGVAALILAATPAVRAAGAYRYEWLTPTNLAPPSVLVEAAMQALPKSVREKQDWLARMRKAAWMPTLDLRYSVGEAMSRNFQVVNRVSTTTGSETQQSRDSSTTSRDSTSVNAGSEFVVDGLGVPESSHSTISEGSSEEDQHSSGTQTTRTSFKSTTRSGPDSFATGESARWLNEVGVFLSWDLSRVVFREEEIAVTGAEMNRESFRQSVKSQVIAAYYDLVESLMLLDNEQYKASIPTQVKRERQAYLLDSLTGGALSSAGGHEAP